MIKVFFHILFFLLISFSQLYAKEIRSRFGFYIDVPNNYFSLNANVDELLEKTDDQLLNKDYFNELMTGTNKSDLDIEYFFPKKGANPEFNNIYITSAPGSIKEYMSYSLDEVCNETQLMFQGLYKKKVKQYKCLFNPKNIKMKKSPGLYYMVHGGPFRNTKLYMYIAQTGTGITTFAMICENKNCNKFSKDLIFITNSRSE